MSTPELSPQAEQTFLEGARRRGVSPEAHLESLLEDASTPAPARSLPGKYARLPVSSESILRSRRDESTI